MKIWRSRSVGGWAFNPLCQRFEDGHPRDDDDEEYIGENGEGSWAYYHDPSSIPSNELKADPYFLVGDAPGGTHAEYVRLFDPAETESASDYLFKATLLATFVPSRQPGMGGREDPLGFEVSEGERDKIYEMQSSFDSGGWHNQSAYEETTPEGKKEYWDHGDYKKIALPYVYKLYDAFINIGELK